MLGRTLIYFSVTIFVYGITEIKVFTVDTSRNTRIIRYLAKHSYTWNESGPQYTMPLVQKMKVRLLVSTTVCPHQPGLSHVSIGPNLPVPLCSTSTLRKKKGKFTAKECPHDLCS